MLSLTLLIGLVQPAFGQLTSQENLSGYHLGMTGKEVSAMMRQKTDRVAVPTDKGRITVGHSYYPPDLSVEWLGETPAPFPKRVTQRFGLFLSTGKIST